MTEEQIYSLNIYFPGRISNNSCEQLIFNDSAPKKILFLAVTANFAQLCLKEFPVSAA